MKITEIRWYPNNNEGNKVVELGTLEGDFNLVNTLFQTYKKKLDRQKIDYVFKVENAPANYYSYSLKRSEFECALKYIPDLEKTW